MTDVQAGNNQQTGQVTKDADAIKLFIGQIPKSYNEEQLTAFLQPYGTIHDISILKNRMTNESKGERAFKCRTSV